jgi:hypothetical protein
MEDAHLLLERVRLRGVDVGFPRLPTSPRRDINAALTTVPWKSFRRIPRMRDTSGEASTYSTATSWPAETQRPTAYETPSCAPSEEAKR